MPDESRTVLVIDDEGDNCELVKRVLKSEPQINVLLAQSPREALSMLQSLNVSAIVIDNRMPEISGVQLLRRLHFQRRKPPAIIVTGFPDDPEVVKCVDEKLAHCVLTKPWEPNDLREALRALLWGATSPEKIPFDDSSRARDS